MNSHFQHFILTHGESLELVLFISIFFIAWNIENIAGVIFNYKKWKHAFINAPFILTNIPGQFLLGLAFVETIKLTTTHHFGFLRYINIGNSSVLMFVMTFIFLDFGEYIYHVTMHKIKRLWRFHLVHHTDNIVDVSTTLREHPGENVIRLSFTLIWVFISGALFWAVLLRQIIQAFSTLFAHMNYRLPEKLDNIIGCVFITPNLHQVHHHYKQPYTDSNYGDVLSVWDRLFGTFKKLPAENLIFGVDTHMKEGENGNFKTIFKIPFERF